MQRFRLGFLFIQQINLFDKLYLIELSSLSSLDLLWSYLIEFKELFCS